MVAKLKDKGIYEVQVLRRRTMALAGMKRISKADADYIVERLDQIEARIIRMDEKPNNNREGRLW